MTSAYLTGYDHMSESGPSTGPVSVTLRGIPAAGLYRTVEGLRAGNTIERAEEAHLYQITSAAGHVAVAGYQCGGWIASTTGGRASDWTDTNCTLAHAVRRVPERTDPSGALPSAVRRVLPATAVDTQQGSIAP